MSRTGSLRQRKKDRTRALLIDVSQRLFRAHGYDAVTLDQICDQAELSVPTLLTYFKSKERLALAPNYDRLDRFKQAIYSPERDATTLALWRAEVAAIARDVTQDPGSVSWRQEAAPALGRGHFAALKRCEEVIAHGLAGDYGTDPEPDLPTLLLASMLVYGNDTLIDRWMAHGGQSDLVAEAVAAVDFAIAHFPMPGARLP